MTAAPPRRRRPAVNEDNKFFWDGLEVRELRIQSCPSCQTLVHPPTPRCIACGSYDRTWVVATGRGVVYSYVTMYKPLVLPFDRPYSVAVVELDEGTRLVSQVIGIPPDRVYIGLPVEVTFTAVDEELILPLFLPAASATDEDD